MLRKLVYIFLLSVTVQYGAKAQSQAILSGDASYDYFQFQEAIKYYEEALKTPNSKTESYLYTRLAECYMFLFQYKKSEEYFSKLVRLGDGKAEPRSYLDYGNVLKANGKYEEARNQFRYYMTLVQDDPYAAFLNKSATWAIANRDTIRNYQVSKTDLDMSGQCVGYNFMDNGLVYAHGRNKEAYFSMPIFDLDYAVMKDSIHFTPGEKYFEDLKFLANESSPSVSKDGSVVYFSANATKVKKGGEIKKTPGIEASGDGISNVQLYVAAFENGRYKNPIVLPFNNKEFNFTHPFISEDGNTLLFASDMEGGMGGFDIYKVIKQADGKWGKPINMGPKINSEENDLYPYVSGGILFYTSKGLNGYGGYDIYVSMLDRSFNATGLTRNIGKPVNSERDDMAMITKDGGITGYFSSNRNNESGDDYLYYFIDKDTYKAPVAVAKVDPVVAKKDIPKPAAAIANTDQPKITPPAPAKQAVKKVSDAELLSRVFDHVYFKFNEASLATETHLTLDSVIQTLKQSKTIKVSIAAYTDSRGTDAYNNALSAKRANAACLYLNAHGISSTRIITKGYGETKLLNKCSDGVECTEDEHAQNRRIEITLVK